LFLELFSDSDFDSIEAISNCLLTLIFVEVKPLSDLSRGFLSGDLWGTEGGAEDVTIRGGPC
jgi:hypothetical protein